MPKININKDFLFNLIKKPITMEELEELLPVAKAENDGYDEATNILSIEFNDTNRPDLWSAVGLARLINSYLTREIPSYNLKSPDPAGKERKIIVDPELEQIRPYIAAFVAEGPAVNDQILEELIETQEKLCGNFGKKREAIAMGIYREEKIEYPIRYMAADPDNEKFMPLGMYKKLTLRNILKEHPKGQEYGSIIKDFAHFPLLKENQGGVLSMPPIINSLNIGAVETGDTCLFVEMTGTRLNSLLLASLVAATNFHDMGYAIYPVTIEYPYELPGIGRVLETPRYFQEKISLSLDYAVKLLGEEMSLEEMALYLTKMGNPLEINEEAGVITVTPPPYRNDFMHAVDILEDVAIGKGLNSFEPIQPRSFTTGRYTHVELFSRKLTDILIGLGYQQMIYNYLSSLEFCQEKMNLTQEESPVVELENYLTERYGVLRNSILPNLMHTESVSADSLYPHKVFEIGQVAIPDPGDNHGARTVNLLGLLYSDSNVSFNELYAHISTLFYFLSLDYNLVPCEDKRFISGRVAKILCGGKEIGILGEIHPDILTNWSVGMPCVVGELDVDLLLEFYKEQFPNKF